MRRLLPLLVLLLAAPSQAEAPPPCASIGSTTVRQNDVARVFERGDFGSERLVGCLRSSDKRMQLSRNYDDGLYISETWSKVRLWQRFVTWRFVRTDSSCKADCPPGYGYWEYDYVRDLATGKRVGIGDLRLGRAFVMTSTSVVATLRRGELRTSSGLLLDTGVDPDSLSASGDRVRWTKDGERKSARL